MVSRPLDQPIFQAFAIAATAGLLGLVINAASADGLPLDRPVLGASGASAAATCVAPEAAVAEINLEEARALHAAGAPFVDARPASEYAMGHVPGALHLASRGECPDADQVIARLRGAGPVVVYDAGASCALARHLTDRLAGEGIEDIRLLLSGFGGWQAAGEPAQSGLCEACDSLADGAR